MGLRRQVVLDEQPGAPAVALRLPFFSKEISIL
jgi:hypothetical protein